MSISQTSEIRRQISVLAAQQQQKINDFIRLQMSEMSNEIEHLKIILRQNEDQLIKQKITIDELSEKIVLIQTRTDSKIQLLGKQLDNFKKYYNQCYAYTVTRVNEVYNRAALLSNQMEKQISNFSITTAVQYVRYAYQLMESIIKGCAYQQEQVKFYLDDQLFSLELELGKFYDYTEQMELLLNDMKIVHFGNSSLKDSIQASNKIIQEINLPGMADSQMGKKVVSFFEPKFKQILKRVNTYSMQIQMVKLMINSDTKQVKSDNNIRVKQITQLEEKLICAENDLQEERKQCQKQVSKKEQILKKRHERILQLQDSLHVLLEKQIKMQHQISELKMHNAEYSKELKIISQKKDQQGLKQAYKKVEQKLLLLQLQHDNLKKKYETQQQTVRILKATTKKTSQAPQINLSRSQRLLKNQQQQSPKQGQRDRSLTKTQKYSLPKTNKERYSQLQASVKKQKKLQLEIVNLYQQNQKLIKDNKQLSNINKSLQEDINNLLIQKARQNKEDEEYLDQIQADSQKYIMEIQCLKIENLTLSRQNVELEAEVEKLEDQLNKQSENFDQKSKNFKNIVLQLQKQIQQLTIQNEELSQRQYRFEDEMDQKERKYLTGSTNLKLPSSPAKDLKSSISRQRRPRKSSTFLHQLQNAIIGSGLPIPICCELDKNGYIRQHKTGNYLVDQNKNPMRVSQSELKLALQSGIILI